MSAQDLILGARVAHLKELKTEIERLKRDFFELKAENDSLKAHFALALMAARELEDWPGKLEIWDGWNLILGAKKEAADKAALVSAARRRLEENGALKVWIVFDGHDERVVNDGRLRVSYTGGTGAHRADRFIVDFVRMAAYLGLGGKVAVRTNDKDFIRQINRLLV